VNKMIGKQKNYKVQHAPEILDLLLHWDFKTGSAAASPGSEKQSDDILSLIYRQYRDYFTSFHQEFGEVKEASGQLQGIVESLEDSSASVKESVASIAQGAQHQASEIGNCTAITETFAKKISHMDQSSRELVNLAGQMSDENRHGKNAMDTLRLNQTDNQEAIQSISREIHALVSKIDSIGEVTEILYSIAFQTNLLSLNASIEAARSGEAGKGFAVVANEIRKLSGQSREASGRISNSIDEIKKELDLLKSTMEVSDQTFSKQAVSVDAATESMQTISSTIDRFIGSQKNFQGEVSGLLHDKDDIIQSISGIQSIAEEFSATTQEVASLTIMQDNSSELLRKMSDTLNGNISQIGSHMNMIKVTAQAENKKRISMIWDLDDPFWEPATREAEKTAKILNFDVDIFAPKSRGSKGVAEMSAHLDQVIDNAYDALVISPMNDAAISQRLQKAAGQGMKIIFLQSVIKGVPYESVVGTDSLACGRSSAQAVTDLMGGQGNVLLGLWNDTKMPTIEERAQGFIEEIGKNPGIHLHTAGVPGGPTDQESDTIISQLLKQYPDTDTVYATNVGWGLAYARYRAAHHSDFKVVTVDFTKDIADHIQKGTIDAAIAQRPFAWGSVTLEMLADLFHGKSVEKEHDTGTYAVTTGNLEIFRKRI